MAKTYSKTRILVECALMIAIGTVLANVKIYELPNGGSVTLLSMLPFVLISFRHGVKWASSPALSTACCRCCWASGRPRSPPSSTFWARCCWTTSWPLRRWAWPGCLPALSTTGRWAWPSAPSRCAFALFVQLLVRRPRVGQPERGPVRLDLQPGLQRQLYAA